MEKEKSCRKYIKIKTYQYSDIGYALKRFGKERETLIPIDLIDFVVQAYPEIEDNSSSSHATTHKECTEIFMSNNSNIRNQFSSYTVDQIYDLIEKVQDINSL